MTNLQLNGERLVGKEADSNVVENVMNKGETFIGEADVVGTKYLTLYAPIKDANGDIIGMWFVGEPIDEMNAIIFAFIGKLLIVLFIGAIIAISGSLQVSPIKRIYLL
ncbi:MULTISPECIES: cache domain-containing protein [Lysinibacillus]|uniref:cache domain-containing protein n=1 Tax=Lysinibacillus TaxID=400634 RepID=UPI0009F3D21B|nr:cache domain-containing protein [Lysinibacillus xylanilyticus]